MIDRRHLSLSVVHQCQLLDINCSGLYYQTKVISEEDLALMKLIDRQYLVTPFYGARKIAVWLKGQNYIVKAEARGQADALDGAQCHLSRAQDQ